jgi:hypothetical protein
VRFLTTEVRIDEVLCEHRSVVPLHPGRFEDVDDELLERITIDEPL